MDVLGYLMSYLQPGNFLIIDLIAATTNALNGAMLARRPDYYKGNHWTIVGILLIAIFGGIGGGVVRDILLNKIPAPLLNPWYLILCVVAGLVGVTIAFDRAWRFREAPFQFQTAFSLPWYAAIGVQAGIDAHLPIIGSILIGVIGPTAGRFLIDITAGRPAKQFVRGEWFVGTAVLTSVLYLVLAGNFGLSIWPATLLSVAVGFAFRVAALWFDWEEPLPKVPPELVAGMPARESLRDKMRPGWRPEM